MLRGFFLEIFYFRLFFLRERGREGSSCVVAVVIISYVCVYMYIDWRFPPPFYLPPLFFYR